MATSVINLPLHQLEQTVIAEHLHCQKKSDETDHCPLELVVLANITLSQLIALKAQCQLSLLAINAINTRNNQQSFRFAAQVTNLSQARAKLAEFAQQHQLEAILINDAPQLTMPGLLVMDMDSTTIDIECIDEIAALAGVGEQVAAVTELAMQGQLDFAQSLHQRVATLANAPETILSDVAANIPLMDGLLPLIDELKKHHWRIAIASGGFTYFSEHLKAELGLDDTFANTLEIIEGKLTGKVLGAVVDAQAKADSIELLKEKYQINQQQTVAMGDGANDLVMMAKAHLGVAFHAKPLVLAKADTCIHFAGLDLLIHWLK